MSGEKRTPEGENSFDLEIIELEDFTRNYASVLSEIGPYLESGLTSKFGVSSLRLHVDVGLTGFDHEKSYDDVIDWIARREDDDGGISVLCSTNPGYMAIDTYAEAIEIHNGTYPETKPYLYKTTAYEMYAAGLITLAYIYSSMREIDYDQEAARYKPPYTQEMRVFEGSLEDAEMDIEDLEIDLEDIDKIDLDIEVIDSGQVESGQDNEDADDDIEDSDDGSQTVIELEHDPEYEAELFTGLRAKSEKLYNHLRTLYPLRNAIENSDFDKKETLGKYLDYLQMDGSNPIRINVFRLAAGLYLEKMKAGERPLQEGVKELFRNSISQDITDIEKQDDSTLILFGGTLPGIYSADAAREVDYDPLYIERLENINRVRAENLELDKIAWAFPMSRDEIEIFLKFL